MTEASLVGERLLERPVQLGGGVHVELAAHREGENAASSSSFLTSNGAGLTLAMLSQSRSRVCD